MQEAASDNGKSTRAWVLAWAVAIVLLASAPYLWGIRVTPPSHRFLGLTHNIDDGAVYLSWMRQVADGHLTFRNLFTNESTTARQFNVLFLLMGGVARVTCLPLVWVFHLFRAGLGVMLMLSIWRFSKLFLESENERRLLIPLVGLSAGIGWLIPGANAVDTWQPEAITFLSIYLNPLFLAGLIMMIEAFYFLLLAERTGQARHAVCAGLYMLALGNVHTYDVLTVAAVWTCYLIVLAVTERRFPGRIVLLSILAGLIAVPSVAYQWRLYQIDPVFRARANSPAPSPAIWSLFAGYGLVLLGAISGAVLVMVRRRAHPGSPLSTLHSPLLLLVWSVIGFALPYVPVAQQRKLVMGLHIPLCILCAYALCWLMWRMPRAVGRGIVLAFILFSAGSNVGFLTQDMNLLSMGRTVTIYRPFMRTDELAAMGFICRDSYTRRSVFAPPTFALFTPALTGHEVYYGHWSETPDYPGKLREWMDFVDPEAPPDYRAEILRRTGAAYYVSVGRETLPPEWLVGRELFQEFRDGQVTVYRARVLVP